MTAYLTADECLEQVEYIARIIPDSLEEARQRLEDIADLVSTYLGPAGDIEPELDAQGVRATMDTPDELRKRAKFYGDKMGFLNVEREMLAVASAWEADIKDAGVYENMANHNADVIDAKQARIEALEKELDTLRLYASPLDQMLADIASEEDNAWMEPMDTDEGDK